MSDSRYPAFELAKKLSNRPMTSPCATSSPIASPSSWINASTSMYKGLATCLRKKTPIRPVIQTVRTATARPVRSERSLEKELSGYLRYQQQHRHLFFSAPQEKAMAFILPGLRRGLMASTPLILASPLLVYQSRHAQRIRCDGPDPLTKITQDLTNGYTSEAQTPIITQSGSINPRAIRQVSMGSILGVVGGLGISVFSRPLAILIGLGIFFLQVSSECGHRGMI